MGTWPSWIVFLLGFAISLCGAHLHRSKRRAPDVAMLLILFGICIMASPVFFVR